MLNHEKTLPVAHRVIATGHWQSALPLSLLIALSHHSLAVQHLSKKALAGQQAV